MTHMIQPAKARRLPYPFVAYPDPDGGYSIAFPDLPGVTTVADDLATIPDAVRDMLAFTFDGDEEDGRLVPAPAATFPEDGVVSLFGATRSLGQINERLD